MEFRAVGNRCAVDFTALQLPLTQEEAYSALELQGFRVVNVDMVALARGCMNGSRYRRGARPSEAPGVVDCSSFVKWLYSQRGIWLPRRSVQQRQCGEKVLLNQVTVGDLIFVSGSIDYWFNDPSDGVGHVGIVSDTGDVIHAANREVGIIETSLDVFIESGAIFRGARRYIPKDRPVVTLETPTHREVEVSSDIRWIVLQSLRKKIR